MLKLIFLFALILSITACGVDPLSTHPRTSRKTTTNHSEYVVVEETSATNSFDFSQEEPSKEQTTSDTSTTTTSNVSGDVPAVCKEWSNNRLVQTNCQNCSLGAMPLRRESTVQYLAPGLCVAVCTQGYYSYQNGERLCLAEKPTCEDDEVYSQESSSCRYVHICDFRVSSTGNHIDRKQKNTSSYVGDVIGCALSGIPCNSKQVDVQLTANNHTRCNFQVNIPGKNMFSGTGKRSLGIDDFNSCSIGSTCLNQYSITIKRTSSNSYQFKTTDPKGFETFGYETFKIGH